MEDLVQAIKSNDLVAVRKVFETSIAPVVTSLIEQEKINIARSVIIEGEEPKEDEDEKDTKSKEKPDEGDDDDEDDDDEDEE